MLVGWEEGYSVVLIQPSCLSFLPTNTYRDQILFRPSLTGDHDSVLRIVHMNRCHIVSVSLAVTEVTSLGRKSV